ncbi:unnamed protein product [Caenorhabditis bovis]|uniref:WH1 domain-containing protein n=1 Tax=Caenorhabditis bovis TaxID=2654633 RepID=A0A8S1EP85_9PELO|nr:unnamed protein product [Caenorhabditis bovis]
MRTTNLSKKKTLAVIRELFLTPAIHAVVYVHSQKNQDLTVRKKAKLLTRFVLVQEGRVMHLVRNLSAGSPGMEDQLPTPLKNSADKIKVPNEEDIPNFSVTEVPTYTESGNDFNFTDLIWTLFVLTSIYVAIVKLKSLVKKMFPLLVAYCHPERYFLHLSATDGVFAATMRGKQLPNILQYFGVMSVFLSSTWSKCKRLSIAEFLNHFADEDDDDDGGFKTDPLLFFSTDIPTISTRVPRPSMRSFTISSTIELSRHLNDDERKSVLTAINEKEKIVASGIVQLLTTNGARWSADREPGVAVFLKNSSLRYYKLIVVKPIDGRGRIIFEVLVEGSEFQTIKNHPHLITLEHNQMIFGLNFYDEKEAESFQNAVENRKTKSNSGKKETSQKPKKGIFANVFTFGKRDVKKKQNILEIGPPTNFRHISHNDDNLTPDQLKMYNDILGELVIKTDEEKEIVKQIVVKNEDKFRQSMMSKRKEKTPKSVKKSNKGKKETPQVSAPIDEMPEDPLNPNWGTSTDPKPAMLITASAPIRLTHTLGSSSVSHKPTENSWQSERITSAMVSPSSSDNSRQASREAHNLYRFEDTPPPTPEIAPPVPCRSISRPVETPPPRLPSHRMSYRWATSPVEAPPPEKIKPQPAPIRHAPPPPMSSSVVQRASVPPPPPPPLPASFPNISAKNSEEVDEEDVEVEEVETKKVLKSLPVINTDRKSLLEEIQNVDRSKVLRKVSDVATIESPTSQNTMIDEIQQFLDARRFGINPSDSEDSDSDSDTGSWTD